MRKYFQLKSLEQKLFYFILFLSFFGLVLRILFVWKHSTAFTYDQARDLLDLREMMVLRKPRLIGAHTSLHGVFYGPLWYWLAFPFYFLTGGHPLTTLVPLILFSFLMPLIFFLLTKDKLLGSVLGVIYIFSSSFFSHSIVALNTNPIIFLTPLFLISLIKFFQSKKRVFLWLALFLIGVSFHFEPIIGLFWLPVFVISVLLFRKLGLVWKNKLAVVFFLMPFVPQLIFEFRHDFLQTRAFLRLISGGGSSLTPGEGDLIARFFDRLKIFEETWFFQSGNNLILAGLFLVLILVLFWRLRKIKKIKKESDYFGSLTLVSLVIVFLGFVLYPYALWPWYLGVVDALILTLIGLGLWALFSFGRKAAFISLGILIILLGLNLQRYLPWPLDQGFSPDPANLRTRLKVVDLVYEDVDNRGFKVFTFAPYVYDFPYQYLIWWRAKTQYHYLPEAYYYLPDQPDYVPAKKEADQMIASKKSECDYLIIEPFENQEDLFWDWRYRFPEAKKVWEIGRTRVEKLCD